MVIWQLRFVRLLAALSKPFCLMRPLSNVQLPALLPERAMVKAQEVRRAGEVVRPMLFPSWRHSNVIRSTKEEHLYEHP